MSTQPHTPGFRPEALLEHREWARRAAHALVFGDAEADDLVQQAWVEVLAHPPRTAPRDIRAWFRGVLRFTAIDAARAASARDRREEAAARPDLEKDTASDVVSRAETIGRVANVVLELDEPYRSAVLLRYFDELPLRAIAAKQDIPLETVRTRLRRALALLRSRLDTEHEGERRAWCLALVPLLTKPAIKTVAAGATAASTTGGVVLMGMNAKVAAAVVAVVLLGGGFLVWSASRSDVPPGGDSVGVLPPSDANSTAMHAAPKQGGTDTAAVDRRPGRAATDADRHRAGVAPLDVPLPPAGDGRITGHVRTESGAPVPGVMLTAVAEVPAEIAAGAEAVEPDATAEPDARIRSFERRVHWEAATRRQATTAADGSYALEGLSQVAYALSAKATSFAVYRTGSDAKRNVRPGAVADFQATPQAQLAVQVLLPGDTPADRSEIRFLGNGNGNYSSRPWTAAQPVLRLVPGRQRVQAIGGEFGELVSDPIDVDLVASGEPIPLTLKLRGRPAICGSVRYPTGLASFAGKVLVLRVEGTEAPPARRIVESPTAKFIDPSDPRFAFSDLTPGRYVVALELPESSGTVEAQKVVEVRDEAVVVDFDVSNLDRRQCVVVTALDADGKPVDDAWAAVSYRSKRGPQSFRTMSIRRAPGVWWIRQPQVDVTAEDGRWVVQVQSSSQGTRDAEYVPGSDAAVEIRFGRAATLTVELAGFAGKGLDGVLSVSASTKTERGDYVYGGGGSPDANGRVTLGPFVPGLYRLLLSVSKSTGPGSSQSRSIAEKEVTVGAGPQEIIFEVPPLYSLTVEAGPERAGVAVFLHLVWFKGDPSDPRNKRTMAFDPVFTDREGRVVFERLTAGDYDVRPNVEGMQPQRITLPGTSVVRF